MLSPSCTMTGSLNVCTARCLPSSGALYRASTYDDDLRSWGYRADHLCAEMLKEELNGAELSEDYTVLDVGCGTGLSGQALRQNGFTNVTGIDISEDSLRLCEAKKCYVRLLPCDLSTRLPFDSDSFSAVVRVGVTSYLQDFQVLLDEWCRVVKSGGIIVFTHLVSMWDNDHHSIATEAAEHCKTGAWRQLRQSPPSEYMPKNPDSTERGKRIYYVAYRVEATARL